MVPGRAFFNTDSIALCVVRYYVMTLSILISLRYRKVPGIALFNVQGILLCVVSFYLRILSIAVEP